MWAAPARESRAIVPATEGSHNRGIRNAVIGILPGRLETHLPMADYSQFATPSTDWTVLERNFPKPPAKETIAQLKEVTNAARETVSAAELISQGKLSVYPNVQLSHILSSQRPSEISHPKRLCHVLPPWLPSAFAHLSTEVDLEKTQASNLCPSSWRRLSLWKPYVGRRCVLTHRQDTWREWPPCHGYER